MRINWENYNPGEFFDEMISSPGYARKPARRLASYLKSLTREELLQKKIAAELAIKTMGISFTVYSDAGNIDREWPFDINPRIIQEKQWKRTSLGLTQRLRALNCFIHDIYNDQKLFKDKLIIRIQDLPSRSSLHLLRAFLACKVLPYIDDIKNQ